MYFWRLRRYEDCIEPLEEVQRYICKLMENELPKSDKGFERVVEEDEETDKGNNSKKEFAGKGKKIKIKGKTKNQMVSYYDTSDSEDFFNGNPLPHDQSGVNNSLQNDPKDSRLCQLSKFNLFGLVKL